MCEMGYGNIVMNEHNNEIKNDSEGMELKKEYVTPMVLD